MLRSEYNIEGLVRAKKEFLLILNKFPGELVHKEFIGSWGICEVVAHLIEWDEATIVLISEVLAGKTPQWIEDIDDFNKHAVLLWKESGWDKLLSVFDITSKKVINQYRGVPKYLRQKFIWPDKDITISEMVMIDISHHKNDHLPGIKKFLRDNRII